MWGMSWFRSLMTRGKKAKSLWPGRKAVDPFPQVWQMEDPDCSRLLLTRCRVLRFWTEQVLNLEVMLMVEILLKAPIYKVFRIAEETLNLLSCLLKQGMVKMLPHLGDESVCVLWPGMVLKDLITKSQKCSPSLLDRHLCLSPWLAPSCWCC